MINLLKSELFKLLKNRALLVVGIILGAYTIFNIGLYFLIFEIFVNGLDESMQITATTAVALIMSDGFTLITLLMVLVCSVIVTDYSRGVMRNLVMSGNTRQSIYLVKLVINSILGVSICLVLTIASMLFFGISNGWGDVSFGRFVAHFAVLLVIFISIASFGTFFAYLTKNVAATIGVTLGVSFLFSIFQAVVMVLMFTTDSQQVIDVLIIISELYVGNLVAVVLDFTISWGKLVQYLLTAIVTILATTSAGIYMFIRSDLK